jgi:phosphatidylglycerophosphate synthase
MHPDIEALRARVRQRRYHPCALVTFLVASGAVARRTAARHPSLFRSWRRRALYRALLLPLVARVLGCAPRSRALWLTYLWQQGDLYLHLGLNRRPDVDVVQAAFPLPTECTALRAYAAAALASGCGRPRRALVCGVVTDILDGYLARRLRQETALGALLDSEYDAYLALAALAAIRRRHGRESALEQAIAIRFGAQFLIGLVGFFASPRPASAGSTRAGKLSGAVQALAFYQALGGSKPGRRMRVALRATAIGAVAAQGLRYARALS